VKFSKGRTGTISFNVNLDEGLKADGWGFQETSLVGGRWLDVIG
jgi:hypothetical protein